MGESMSPYAIKVELERQAVKRLPSFLSGSGDSDTAIKEREVAK
jgi:hypothetical protein